MKKLLFLIFVLSLTFFLISCETQIKEKLSDVKLIQKSECASDSDCSTAGCSGQICGSKEKIKDIITTCEWKEEYSCLKLTSCRCINNKCQWEENNDYRECIKNVKIY